MESVLDLKCQYCGIPVGGNSQYCCDACEILATQTGPLSLAPQNPFEYLNKSDFRDLYHHGPDFDYLFYAEGLHCSSCVHLLEKLPVYCEDVATSRVNFAQSTVAVSLKPGASLANVAFVIQELGYKPSLLAPADNPQEKFIRENRLSLMRIAVAGFCAGNIMLFVIPVYSGLAGHLGHAFNWISFLLFLPVLLFSAVPFLKGAWAALRFRVVNVDLPIAVALLSGFILSTVNLLRGNGAIYYDSTAGFMFLILSARYLLKRVQQNYLSPTRTASFFGGEKFLRANFDGTEIIPWNQVRENDKLILTRDQPLPADAVLISASATLDMSLFNGESLPRDFAQGMTLFAGSRVLDEEIQVRALGDFSVSKMGRMFSELDQEALQKSPFVTLTDRLSQKLILTVFSVAVLFFLVYQFVDFSEAFNRSLALIVLACPCALAFGSPLTLGMALKKAQRMGILLRNSNSFEKILKIQNVFFDKTGTLTEGSLGLVHTAPAVIPADLQKIILSIEARSWHPIAFALRKAWKTAGALYPVTDSREVLGRGVSGTINGHLFEIRHLSETMHDAELAVEVFKDHESQCRLYFTDTLREDSAAIVAKLQAQRLNCFILSGDRKGRVKAVAKECGLAPENCHGELFPEDKRDILAAYKNTCMIGDGANDSLSLQKADVGIAVKGSVDLSLQSADIYFTRGGLSPLLDLLNLSRQTRRVLIRNLSISLVYNSVGGVLALMGLINPLMAAVLMPVSSALIVLSSLWGFR